MLSIAATTAATAGAETTPAAPSPRLIHAAHEFEAQMMKELLKPMMASNGLNGEDDNSASGSGGVLGEFATEALGRGLSEQGGFGIATSIVKQLYSAGNKHVTSQVTGNLHGNTVMKTYE
jgi:Rod binding domain-containing protein